MWGALSPSAKINITEIPSPISPGPNILRRKDLRFLEIEKPDFIFKLKKFYSLLNYNFDLLNMNELPIMEPFFLQYANVSNFS